MAQAVKLGKAASAGRGPLHGIPIAIKDVIDVVGLPTRAGSRTREHIAPSASDATIVARLRTAGAIVVGKAHTTEFAYFDGPPPTRNPHDLARTPGGSSSGPAAVVAAGMVPLSIGTQTAGSVCRPAAYCGIAAFKPSTLAWPTFGVVPFAPSFDTVGVFGYRTADATAVARVLMPPFLSPCAQLDHDRDRRRPHLGIGERCCSANRPIRRGEARRVGRVRANLRVPHRLRCNHCRPQDRLRIRARARPPVSRGSAGRHGDAGPP
jgi:Asp-tRNA(Asn)/Glu-tRNA(Gln) amidotransferase A subunit family amidase